MTTKGIWVAPYSAGKENLFLFDIEGSDSI